MYRCDVTVQLYATVQYFSYLFLDFSTIFSEFSRDLKGNTDHIMISGKKKIYLGGNFRKFEQNICEIHQKIITKYIFLQKKKL
jgi:hypothetical protein